MKVALVMLVASLIVGCGVNNNTRDLRGFVDDVMSQPRGYVEPLPVFEPYQAFSYSATGLRSPFDLPIALDEITARPIPTSSLLPDSNRSKEQLENYSLLSLSMVGTIKVSEGTLWALVSAPEGGVHKVREGFYMGQNHGRIVNVNVQRIDLIEIVPNGVGGWIERPRTLVLDGVDGE